MDWAVMLPLVVLLCRDLAGVLYGYQTRKQETSCQLLARLRHSTLVRGVYGYVPAAMISGGCANSQRGQLGSFGS